VITGHTAVYAVLGHPVSHSRSPQMHAAAFAHHGIDAVYVALPVRPERLGDAIRGAHALGFQGLNVTVPHKEAAAALCLGLDEVASEIGAVNTLRRAPDGWEGFNTDAPACLELLEAAGVKPGARALLVGAGGAARAVAWALLRRGAQVRVAARRTEAAQELVDTVKAAGSKGTSEAVEFGDLAEECDAADVVVNGTSVGLAGTPPAVAGFEPHLPMRVRAGQVVMDVVYGDTELARQARAVGARFVSGEQMLVRQGALAFTIWTDREAPEELMAAAIAPGRTT
jgi:shikimate dehydrogenase